MKDRLQSGVCAMPAGVHDDACEVLFDVPFPEGSDLSGRCNGKCGGILAAGELLNLSKPHAVAVTGACPSAANTHLSESLICCPHVSCEHRSNAAA